MVGNMLQIIQYAGAENVVHGNDTIDWVTISLCIILSIVVGFVLNKFG